MIRVPNLILNTQALVLVKIILAAYEVAATTTLDVMAYAKQQSYVDPGRIVVLGQSYGGMTAITVAAKNSPLIAVINFAGGGGGNPETRAK